MKKKSILEEFTVIGSIFGENKNKIQNCLHRSIDFLNNQVNNNRIHKVFVTSNIFYAIGMSEYTIQDVLFLSFKI